MLVPEGLIGWVGTTLLEETMRSGSDGIGTVDGLSGQFPGGTPGNHLGGSDSTAGFSGKAVQTAIRKPAVTHMNDDEDDDPPEEKPLVWKPTEPKPRFSRDWEGFPIPDPPAEGGSEDAG
jgi:hypothetical protein